MRRLKLLLGSLFLGCMALPLQAQDFSLGTSLPSLLTGTINIEPSIPLSSRLTLHLGLSARPKSFGLPMPTGMIHWLYNGQAASFSDRLRWSQVDHAEQFSVTPSLRLWRKGHYNRGMFFGAHALGMIYRYGSDAVESTYSQGYLLGAGLSLGYAYEIAPHWNLEAEGGLTGAWTSYDLYHANGSLSQADKSRLLVLPSRIALRLVYLF